MKYFSVLAAELCNLIECALRRFAAVTHGGTVEAAEGAMLFGAPPTSARSFERDDGFDILQQSIFAQLVEMIVVGGDWKLVKLFDWANDVVRNDGYVTPTIDDAVELDIGRGLTIGHARDEFRKIQVPFAGADQVDEREAAVQLDAHLTFAIAAAKGDQNVRMLLFYAAG